MGSGKSTVGARVAARTGRAFVDLDQAVEAAAGRSIAEQFADDGEAAFRARELAALRSVLETEVPTVVATGGGIVTTEAARDALAERAHVVWLDAPPEVLALRVGGGDDRPLLAGDPTARLRELDAERRPLYAHLAHVVIDAAASDADLVAERVLDALEVPA